MDEPLGHRIPVPPAPAAVDVAAQNAALAALHGPDPGPAAAAVLAAAHAYAPPVLAALAVVLFADGLRDEGAFWFYAGTCRTARTPWSSAQP